MFKTIIFSLNAIKLLDDGNKSFRNGYTTSNFLDSNLRSNLENISACLCRQSNWTLQIYIQSLSLNRLRPWLVLNILNEESSWSTGLTLSIHRYPVREGYKVRKPKIVWKFPNLGLTPPPTHTQVWKFITYFF